MIKLVKELYTSTVEVTGGRRDGRARSTDGILDVNLQAPREIGGPGGGSNPEQLFAAAYAACYLSAMGAIARQRKVPLDNTQITADVTLGVDDTERYGLRVRLSVTNSTMDQEALRELAEAAHQVCPFSRAVSGNIEVTTEVG